MGHLATAQSTIINSWQEHGTAVADGLFTVYGMSRIESLEHVRINLEWSYVSGATFKNFLDKTFKVFLEEYAGKKTDVTPKAARIYNFWMHYAHSKARYKEQISDVFCPWWQYVSIVDQSTRRAENVLDGKIFHFHDPIWRIIYPPACLGARARIRTRHEHSLERSGLVPSTYTVETRQTTWGSVYNITIDGKPLWIDGNLAAKDFVST